MKKTLVDALERTGVIAVFILIFALPFYCGAKYDAENPYAEGSHWNYRIIIENGFVYKHQNGATFQIFNSDGTPLRAGKKIY